MWDEEHNPELIWQILKGRRHSASFGFPVPAPLNHTCQPPGQRMLTEVQIPVRNRERSKTRKGDPPLYLGLFREPFLKFVSNWPPVPRGHTLMKMQSRLGDTAFHLGPWLV